MRGFRRQNNPKKGKEGGKPSFFFRPRFVRVHPLFLLSGIFYACTGELFLFLMSAFVAIQHECAHAFAAAKLGYKLNAIVLMPYGAVIDGDLRGISFKEEIFVALSGPICNLVTAFFFVALWWLFPSLYPFTDAAAYASLSIALVNLLPAYPLDGGRVLQCALARAFSRSTPNQNEGEKRAKRVCKIITVLFAALLLFLFIAQVVNGQANLTLLLFGVFLVVGAKGSGQANYERAGFAFYPDLKRGVEIHRIAISDECEIKTAFKFLARGSYLLLDVFHGEQFAFTLSQNELSEWFLRADSPRSRLCDLRQKATNGQKTEIF